MEYKVADNGECSKCKEEVNEADVIKCAECLTIFHALCGRDTPFCCKTFLGSFKKSGINFRWHCDPCLTKQEQNQASDMKNQITQLTATVTTLVKQFAAFQQTTQPAAVEQPTPWKNAQRVQKMKASLCIRNNDGTPVDMKKVQEIASNNNIQVTKTNVKENGEVFVVLPSDENREKLIPLLEETTEVVRIKNKLPTITILGVQKYTTKEEFVENIKKQNPQLKEKLDTGSEFTIVFSKKTRENEEDKGYQVVARVSEEVRHVIKNADNKIYMDLTAQRVVDRFYIKRCNKCQQFGHYEKDCTSNVCCGYCTQQHKSYECDQVEEGDFQNYNCANCKNTNKESTGHSAHWHKCPTLLEQQQKAKKGIPYYNNRKN